MNKSNAPSTRRKETPHVLIAENGEEAKHLFFELVPESAEIFLGASIMLETLGTNWVSTVKVLS